MRLPALGNETVVERMLARLAKKAHAFVVNGFIFAMKYVEARMKPKPVRAVSIYLAPLHAFALVSFKRAFARCTCERHKLPGLPGEQVERRDCGQAFRQRAC